MTSLNMYFPPRLKNKVKSILASLDSLKQDFPALVLLTFWAGYFYGVGGCPLYCKKVSSIPKMSLDIAKCRPKTPLESYCSKELLAKEYTLRTLRTITSSNTQHLS